MILTSATVYGAWKLIEYKYVDEEVYMSFEQRCRKYGFNTERHYVTTEDGYILQMFRVINPLDINQNKIPVFLQHGLQDCWIGGIVNGDKSPIAVLSKGGFDVWVGNSRGNSYSRYHKTLNPDTDPEYWNFWFEEMGLYDTKAVIKHIKNTADQPKVAYIGGSQGAAQMFYALVFDNEWYKHNMSIFIALGPVLKPGVDDLPSAIKFGKSKIFKLILDALKIEEFPAKSKIINRFYCALQGIYPGYGDWFASKLTEGDTSVNDPVALQRMFSYQPEGYKYI